MHPNTPRHTQISTYIDAHTHQATHADTKPSDIPSSCTFEISQLEWHVIMTCLTSPSFQEQTLTEASCYLLLCRRPVLSPTSGRHYGRYAVRKYGGGSGYASRIIGSWQLSASRTRSGSVRVRSPKAWTTSTGRLIHTG